jgi:hypothetical protein
MTKSCCVIPVLDAVGHRLWPFTTSTSWDINNPSNYGHLELELHFQVLPYDRGLPVSLCTAWKTKFIIQCRRKNTVYFGGGTASMYLYNYAVQEPISCKAIQTCRVSCSCREADKCSTLFNWIDLRGMILEIPETMLFHHPGFYILPTATNKDAPWAINNYMVCQ